MARNVAYIISFSTIIYIVFVTWKMYTLHTSSAEIEFFFEPKGFCTKNNPKQLKESKWSNHLDSEYGKSHLSHSTIRAAMKDTIVEISKIGIENDIRFVTVGATMLGTFLNNEVLPYDDDLDFGVLSRREWRKVIELDGYENESFVMKVNKYSVCRYSDYHNAIDARLIHKNTGVFADILFYHTKGNMIQSKFEVHGEPSFPMEWFFPLQVSDVCGYEIYIPSQPLKYLEKNYNLHSIEDSKKLVDQLQHGQYEFDFLQKLWKTDGKVISCKEKGSTNTDSRF